MIRLVVAAVAIYLGAIVSATSYLPLLDDATTTMAAPPAHDAHARAQRAYAALPVAFVPNAGQLDPRVYYHARGDRYAFYLTRDGVTLAFLDRASGAGSDAASGGASDATSGAASAAASAAALHDRDGYAVTLRFAGADPRVVPRGEERIPGDVNYFRGSDASQWRSGLGRYARIVYRDVWPGIDVRLFERGGILKYEFLVHVGARPEAIRLAYAGASGLALDGDGSLRIGTSMGALHDSAPVSYQTIGGTRVPVDSRFALETTAPAAESGRISRRTSLRLRRRRLSA